MLWSVHHLLNSMAMLKLGPHNRKGASDSFFLSFLSPARTSAPSSPPPPIRNGFTIPMPERNARPLTIHLQRAPSFSQPSQPSQLSYHISQSHTQSRAILRWFWFRRPLLANSACSGGGRHLPMMHRSDRYSDQEQSYSRTDKNTQSHFLGDLVKEVVQSTVLLFGFLKWYFLGVCIPRRRISPKRGNSVWWNPEIFEV